MEPDMTLVKNGYHLLDQRDLEQRGDAESLFVMSDRLVRGIIVPQDKAAGWKLAIQAARLGHPVAIARCRFNGMLTKNCTIDQAINLMRECFNLGHAIAQKISISNKYFQCVLSWKAVIPNCKLSAGQNYPPAIFDLGRMNNNEHALGVNKEIAFDLYDKAAKLGYWKAAYEVGRCHEFGIGTKTNESEAIRYYRIAANKNYSGALLALGLCYSSGTFVERCYVMGAALMRIGGYAKKVFNTFENLSGDELAMVEALTTSLAFFTKDDAKRAVNFVCSRYPIDAEIVVSFSLPPLLIFPVAI
jgi:TPR repeat protein